MEFEKDFDYLIFKLTDALRKQIQSQLTLF